VRPPPRCSRLINQPGGYTVVYDYVIDNVVNVSTTQANATLGADYGDGTVHVYKDTIGGMNDDGTFAATLYDYDYDSVPDTLYFGDLLGIPAALTNKFIGSMGSSLHAYFGDLPDQDKSADNGLAFPNSFATRLVLYGRVNAHHGGDQINTTVRMTVPRIRIYTPEQPAGWLPPD
jgi:hypothetical protein